MGLRRGLIFAPLYPPRTGGAAVHYSHLSRSFVEKGIMDQPIIITCFTSGEPIVESTDNKIIFRCLLHPDLVHEGNTYIRLGFNLTVTLLTVLIGIGIFRIPSLQMHTKPEYRWACTAAQWLGASVIIDARDPWAPQYNSEGDVFVVASRNIEELSSHRSERVEYIPVAIEPSNFPESDPDVRPFEEPYNLFVGDVAERKGVDVLLEYYRSHEPDRPLVIIGRTVEDDLLREANQLDNVHYRGTLSHEDTIKYIDNAELVILPSRKEGLGRVILESFMMDTKTICPPDIPEFNKHVPEHVLEEFSAESLSQKINEVESIRHPPKYPIERHYVSNIIDRYRDVYESLK